jgi:hypothetical protein
MGGQYAPFAPDQALTARRTLQEVLTNALLIFEMMKTVTHIYSCKEF